jgi:hypothetical protein
MFFSLLLLHCERVEQLEDFQIKNNGRRRNSSPASAPCRYFAWKKVAGDVARASLQQQQNCQLARAPFHGEIYSAPLMPHHIVSELATTTNESYFVICKTVCTHKLQKKEHIYLKRLVGFLRWANIWCNVINLCG